MSVVRYFPTLPFCTFFVPYLLGFVDADDDIIIIVGTYVIYKYITRAHSWGMANSIGNTRISKG